MTCVWKRETEQLDQAGNVSGLYSADARFEPRPGHQLPWLGPVAEIRPPTLPSTSLRINFSLIILPFNILGL
jgi:hypothetical protein